MVELKVQERKERNQLQRKQSELLFVVPVVDVSRALFYTMGGWMGRKMADSRQRDCLTPL